MYLLTYDMCLYTHAHIDMHIYLHALCISMYYICTFVYTCVCRYAYRIAGKTGREKTLPVWQCKLKFVNVKFVMLKKKNSTKPHEIISILKCRVREMIPPEGNDCTLLSAKELKEVNKKVHQCHNVRRD